MFRYSDCYMRRGKMKLLFDIHSKGQYPANSLSNFANHHFVLDQVPVSCMEGLLQSLKAPLQDQSTVCQMDGHTAKKYGSAIPWQENGGLLQWQGIYFSRYSKEYWHFLVRAYDALADQNDDYAQALLDTGHRLLWHSIGRLRKSQTCLTTVEFVALLYHERRRVRKRIRRR